MIGRLLVVADAYPWPARDGYRQRIATMVGLLAEMAEVEMLVVTHPGEPTATPAPLELAKLWSVCCGWRRAPERARALASGLPRRIAWRDWTAARRELAGLADRSFDAVWVTHVDLFVAAGPELEALGPVVVDVPDMEDWTVTRALRAKGSASMEALRSVVARRSLRPLGAMLLDRLEVPRWRRVHAGVRDRAEAVVVCSEADKRRLGGEGVAVVPNGYDWDGPVVCPPVPPVILMVGNFTYQPNLQAARYFAHEVWPLVKAGCPQARLRLVGRHDRRLEEATRGSGAELVGEVPDVHAELLGARVAVAPLLAGSGTRIKILEAWAHGLPVVSTSVGCDGLEARHGEHLLVAGEPQGLAQACLNLLHDDELWRRLSAQGRDLWERSYRWSVAAASLREVVAPLLAGRAR